MKSELICYLCGRQIEEVDLSDDHVPPRQFYPSALRRGLDKLETFPAHKECNKSYERDEVYFLNTLGPLAMQSSDSGIALWNDLKKSYGRFEGSILAKQISGEFSDRTEAGIILPNNMMYKYFDPIRVWRIIWKITRGLYYKENKVILPENRPRKFDIIQPEYKTPHEGVQLLIQSPPKGVYPDIFDYKFISTSEFHYWGFCFWKEIIMTAIFHVLDCKCDDCLKSN